MTTCIGPALFLPRTELNGALGMVWNWLLPCNSYADKLEKSVHYWFLVLYTAYLLYRAETIERQ